MCDDDEIVFLELRNALGICHASMELHDIARVKQRLSPEFASEREIAWRVLFPNAKRQCAPDGRVLACDCPYQDGHGVGNDHLPECPAATKEPHVQ